MGFEVGSILEGKVTGITKFGAFVSLPENRSGLVHISEIAYTYVNDIHEHLSEGQAVTVKVIGIDENNRINLSMKQVLPPPARPERRPNARPAGYRNENGGERRPGRRPGVSSFQAAPPQPKGPVSFEDQLVRILKNLEEEESK